MKTWLYLTAEGLQQPSPEWPCCFWQEGQAPQVDTLAHAAPMLAGRVITLILPMECCSWWLTEKWRSRRRPSSQAVAYAIEEHLAQELEALHIAVGPADQHQRYPALVIERQWLESLLAMLMTLGIEASSVNVDADMLPKDQACGAWWFGRWIVGGAQEARIALSTEAREIVDEAFATPLHWLNEPSQAPITVSGLLSANAGHAIDLRQGLFRRRRLGLPWRSLASALLLTFLVAWGFTQARSHFLEQEAARLYGQSEQRFKTLYPEQTRIVDLAAQLKALQANEGLARDTRLTQLRVVAEHIIGGSSVEIQRIEYRAGEGWKIQLTANSFAELEQLRERGRQNRLPIKLGSASKDQNRVRSVLTLEEKS